MARNHAEGWASPPTYMGNASPGRIPKVGPDGHPICSRGKLMQRLEYAREQILQWKPFLQGMDKDAHALGAKKKKGTLTVEENRKYKSLREKYERKYRQYRSIRLDQQRYEIQLGMHNNLIKTWDLKNASKLQNVNQSLNVYMNKQNSCFKKHQITLLRYTNPEISSLQRVITHALGKDFGIDEKRRGEMAEDAFKVIQKEMLTRGRKDVRANNKVERELKSRTKPVHSPIIDTPPASPQTVSATRRCSYSNELLWEELFGEAAPETPPPTPKSPEAVSDVVTPPLPPPPTREAGPSRRNRRKSSSSPQKDITPTKKSRLVPPETATSSNQTENVTPRHLPATHPRNKSQVRSEGQNSRVELSPPPEPRRRQQPELPLRPGLVRSSSNSRPSYCPDREEISSLPGSTNPTGNSSQCNNKRTREEEIATLNKSQNDGRNHREEIRVRPIKLKVSTRKPRTLSSLPGASSRIPQASSSTSRVASSMPPTSSSTPRASYSRSRESSWTSRASSNTSRAASSTPLASSSTPRATSSSPRSASSMPLTSATMCAEDANAIEVIDLVSDNEEEDNTSETDETQSVISVSSAVLFRSIYDTMAQMHSS